MKLYHVTFNLLDESEMLFPRVPNAIGNDEDNTTPRVCFSDSIEHCMQAIATCNRRIEAGRKFLLKEAEIDPDDEHLISPYDLVKEKRVLDALENTEFWYTKPIRVTVKRCIIRKFWSNYTLAWSCISREQCANVINSQFPEFNAKPNDYKLPSEIYGHFCEWTKNYKNKLSMQDDIFDLLAELPYAQKIEILGMEYSVEKEIIHTMERVRCISIRESVPDQIQYDKKYWIDPLSKWKDIDGTEYAQVYTSEDKEFYVGTLRTDHFVPIPRYLYESSLDQYINNHTAIMLKDIFHWCMENPNTDSSKSIIKYINDNNLNQKENMEKDYYINRIPLTEFEKKRLY